ncbi:hypothetical protein AB0N14_17635 [Streptomyces sp. NPDC051104]|uniref:hypothetical protein n=1 Tax=Streptomyces sp. NPDC051104 TaxID=3155044 RepID=UPI003423F717
MADEQAGVDEEAQRVFDALDDLMAMEDEGARARAISAVLRRQQDLIKRLSGVRRDYVLKQRAAKVSVRKLAAELEVSPSTIQDIERGYSGSGKTRPRKEKDDATGSGGDADA